MVLYDQQIAELATQGMIAPFIGNQIRENDQKERVISYGLSSHGYDIRLAEEFKVLKVSDVNDSIDPKNIKENNIFSYMTKVITLQPNSMVLGRSFEYIRMPKDVMAICMGKSTYARVGILINTTPIEAGWHGNITIEISNTSHLPVNIYANEGIAQLLFFRSEDIPSVTYADKGGKYQGQTGVTIARM